MVKDEWYKNKTWNGKIDSNFEDQLKRTRNPANKAEYLQIQGCCLLENGLENIQEVGIEILHRLFSDFSSAYSSVIPGQEQLAAYYLRKKNYERAIHFFKLVVKYCTQQNSRSGTSTMADLKLAETILRSQLPDQLEEAYQYLINYPVMLLKTNDTKLYYAELGAQICDTMNKKQEAKEFAIKAIVLSKTAKHLFIRYNQDGQQPTLQFRTLHEISESVEK